MTELFELVRKAIGLAVLSTAPVAVAAVVGAIGASLLGLWTGITDPVVGLVARALAVVLAVAVLFAFVAGQVEALTHAAFASIPHAGQPGSP